jgi:RNA polymerase sigma-70 factor (ECF subfamily)
MTYRDIRVVFDGSSSMRQTTAEENAVDATPLVSVDGSSLLDRLRFKLSSDEDLAAKLQAGNMEALTVLFERHSPLVFRNARRVLCNDAEAEEIAQQVFLELIRSVRTFNPQKGTFKAWLLMFAYCRTINRWRQLRSSHFYDSESVEDLLPEIVQGAQRTYPFQAAEAVCLVEQALSMIQPRQRRTVELIYYEGLTPEEVSEKTGESVPAVRHNLYRGLEKIRSVLGEAIADNRASKRKKSSESKDE